MSDKKTLNRRQFLGTAAAVSTISVLPRRVLGGPGYVAPSDKINVALVGSGTQAMRQLMSNWLPREDLHLACVCDPNKDSDDYRDWSPHGLRDRVREFIKNPRWGSEKGIRAGREAGKELIESYYANIRGMGDYKGLKAYEDYREMLAEDNDIDLVIDMTPEHLHGVINIQAMKAGKHVVSHKSLALSVKDLRSVIETSKECNVFYMEALWSRFNLTIRKALELINQKEIGSIKYINADFCFPAAVNLDGRLFNKSLAGGALLDIGIYPVFLSYSILGMPELINSSVKLHESGVDQQCAMMFKYKDAHSMLYSSFDVKSKMEARIYGEHGYILLQDRWHEAAGLSLVKNGLEQDFAFPLVGNGFTEEIRECQKCVEMGKLESDLWSHKDSLQLMSILEKIMNLTGISY